MNGVFPDEIRPSSQCRIDRLHCDGPRFCACLCAPPAFVMLVHVQKHCRTYLSA